MKRKEVKITEKGTYEFGDNYELIFLDDNNYYLTDCNITCGNYCYIDCGYYCNITCGDNCEIDCGNDCNISCRDNCKINCVDNCKINCVDDCNITCGNDCQINCEWDCNITCGNHCKIYCRWRCYIKAGDGSQLYSYDKLKKTILKDEEFIWWYINTNRDLINTFEDVDWKKENLDKWNEFYAFVHNELDSAILF